MQIYNDFVYPVKAEKAQKRLEEKRARDRALRLRNIERERARDRERYAQKKNLPH